MVEKKKSGVDPSSQQQDLRVSINISEKASEAPNLLHGFQQEKVYALVADASPETAFGSPSMRLDDQSASFGLRNNYGGSFVLPLFGMREGGSQSGEEDSMPGGLRQNNPADTPILKIMDKKYGGVQQQPQQQAMQTAQLNQMFYDYSQQKNKDKDLPQIANNSLQDQKQTDSKQQRHKPQISPMKAKYHQKSLVKNKQASYQKLTFINNHASSTMTANQDSSPGGGLQKSRATTKSHNNMMHQVAPQSNQSSTSSISRMFPTSSRPKMSTIKYDAAVSAQGGAKKTTSGGRQESSPFAVASDQPRQQNQQQPHHLLSSHLKQFYERKTFGGNAANSAKILQKGDQSQPPRRQKSADLTNQSRSSNGKRETATAPAAKVQALIEYHYGTNAAFGGSGRHGGVGERFTSSHIVTAGHSGSSSFFQVPRQDDTKSNNDEGYPSLDMHQAGESYKICETNRQSKQLHQNAILSSDSKSQQPGVRRSASFVSQNQATYGHSPKRVALTVNPNTNKLHEKVTWFYRRLCEEYDCPTLQQFLQETIPTAFKSQNLEKKRDRSIGSTSSLNRLTNQHSPRRSPKAYLSGQTNVVSSEVKPNVKDEKKMKDGSGVVQLNSSILTDRTVQAVCDTLRRFQKKIKVFELYHNQAYRTLGSSMQMNKGTPYASTTHRISSPSRAFANAAQGPWTFPKPMHLFNLLKSLTRTTIVRVIADTDCPCLVTEQYYQSLIASLSRQPSSNENSNNVLGTSFRNLLLGTIDVQGFHMKPSFVKSLITQIRSKQFTKLMSLSLQSCNIQDAEGQDLCKVAILGKQTPCLKTLCLAKNQLGFKFGASLIAQLIDAQSIAQEETMNAVVGSSAPDQPADRVIKFESLDHFAIEKIDLEYNKISMLVIRAVEQQLKNLHQFKEQAKLHQNMFQMQSTTAQGGARSQQQGSSLAATIASQMTGYGSSNNNHYELQPNKVIIEQTEESSISSHNDQSQDSLDMKELPTLFEEFITANAARLLRSKSKSNSKSNQRSLMRLRSVSGINGARVLDNIERSTCKTPEAQVQRVDISTLQQSRIDESGPNKPQMQILNQLKDESSGDILRNAKNQALTNETNNVNIYIGVDNLETESNSTKGNNHEYESSKEFSQAVQYTKIIQANQQQQPQKIKLINAASDNDIKRISPRPLQPKPKTMSITGNQKPNGLLAMDASPPPHRYNQAPFDIVNGPILTKSPQVMVSNPILDRETPKTILISQFLDENSAIKTKSGYSSPSRLPAKRATQQSSGTQANLNTAHKQQTQTNSTKLTNVQVSPIRVEQLTSSQKPTSTGMKEKMEHTSAKIGNFMDPESVKARTQFNFSNKVGSIAATLMGQLNQQQMQQQQHQQPLIKSAQGKKKKSNTRHRMEGYLERNSGGSEQQLAHANASNSAGSQQQTGFSASTLKDSINKMVTQHSSMNTAKGILSDRSHYKSPKKSFVSVASGYSTGQNKVETASQYGPIKRSSFAALSQKDKQTDQPPPSAMSSNAKAGTQHQPFRKATNLGAQLQQVIMSAKAIGASSVNQSKYSKSNKSLAKVKNSVIPFSAKEGERLLKSPRINSSRNALNEKSSSYGQIANKSCKKVPNKNPLKPLRSSSQTALANLQEKVFTKKPEQISTPVQERSYLIKALVGSNAITQKNKDKLNQVQSQNQSAKKVVELEKAQQQSIVKKQTQVRKDKRLIVAPSSIPTVQFNLKAPNKQLGLTKSISAPGDKNPDNDDELEDNNIDEQISEDNERDITPKLSEHRPGGRNYFSNDLMFSPSQVTTIKSPIGPSQDPKIIEDRSQEDIMSGWNPFTSSNMNIFSEGKVYEDKKFKLKMRSFKESISASIQSSVESSPNRQNFHHKRTNQVLFDANEGPKSMSNIPGTNQPCDTLSNSFLTVIDQHQQLLLEALPRVKNFSHDFDYQQLHISPRDSEALLHQLMESPAQELNPKDPHEPKDRSLSLVSQTQSAPPYRPKTTSISVSVPQVNISLSKRSVAGAASDHSKGSDMQHHGNKNAFNGVSVRESQKVFDEQMMSSMRKQVSRQMRSGQSLGEAPHPHPIMNSAAMLTDKKCKSRNDEDDD